MSNDTRQGLTRRDLLRVGGATFALAPDATLAQAVKTGTEGLIAGDFQVKIGDYSMPVLLRRISSSTETGMRRNDSTTAGSKCVPAQRLISTRAASNGIALE